MKLIVAVDEKWGIGKDGDLLKSIPEDMKFFREKTKRAILVMGYNTLLSFPNSKPLPGRLNIVLADKNGLLIPGAVVCDYMVKLAALITNFRSDDVYVIGGGSMYRQLLPFCDTAYITKMRFDGGADTFIPNIDELSAWTIESESDIRECDGIKYSFVTYRNRTPAAFPSGVTFRNNDADIPEIFSRKSEVTFSLLDSYQYEYRRDIAHKLSLIFKPLEYGLSSRDVDFYLGTGGAEGASFKKFLLIKRKISTPEMISACNDFYDNDDVEDIYRIRVKREELDKFIGYLESGKPAESIYKEFLPE